MWLMTKYGFFSIVQKQPNQFHVRSREIKDVENLVKHVPLPKAEIMQSSETDYAVRIIVGRDELLTILKFLGKSIDYDNFKSKIAVTPNQAHKPYHDVWNVLADSLGAYGRPGRSKRRGTR